MAAKIQTAEQLSDLLAAGPLEVRRAVAILRQITGQIAELHSAGRIDGAIHASRVIVDGETARLAATDTSGESQFNKTQLPPELESLDLPQLPERIEEVQAVLLKAGSDLDPRRIDIYQLGCLTCEMLTGGSLQTYLFSPRAKARVTESCRHVLDGMLGYEPTQRFASCAELETELDRIATSEPQPVSPETPPRGTGIDALTNTPRTPHPVATSLPVAKLGHYQIVARLGSGGMGDVYRGYDPQLERTVALKVLPPELARQSEFVRRFTDEAKAAAKIVHPNIVQIYSIGEDEGLHYFAMQYVAGETLAARLSREKRFSLDDALAIIEQVLAGLAIAHRQGMIHRDIKPGNILLDTEHGRALLADFGLVKSLDSSEQMTATGMVMGTVDYISPEQGRGQKVDTRSDLYSVGVLFYQMLSGQLPFVAESPTAMIFQHAYEKPRPLEDYVPHVAAGASAIVRRLLAKDPADRYQTADDLLADIRSLRVTPNCEPDSFAGSESDKSIVIKILDDDSDDEDRRLTVALAPLLQARWQDRLRVLFHLHAPALIKNLQNTEQQVDGAVAIYQARRDKLAGLAHEAAAVERQLAVQGLETERLEQQAAREEIELRLAKADATLQRLRSQQGVLRARLSAVQAERVLTEGGSTKARIFRPRNVGVAVVGVGVLSVAVMLLLHKLPSANFLGFQGESDQTATEGRLSFTKTSPPSDAIFPTAGWISLAPFIDVRKGSASEAWEATDDGFRITNSVGADSMTRFVEIPMLIRGSYEVRFRYQMVRDRHRGFNVRFPVGAARACLGFGSTRGSNGIGINGVHGLDALETANPTSRPGFPNPADVEREAVLHVDQSANGTVHLAVSIDGSTQIDWSGKEADVQILESTIGAKLSKSPIIILHAWGNSVTLRQLALRMRDGWAEPLRAASATNPNVADAPPKSTRDSAPPTSTLVPLAASAHPAYDVLTSDEWEWTKPVNAGSVINSDKDDAAPFISADGLTLLFESRRPGGYGGLDIWSASRSSVDQPWTTPVNLGATINSDADDYRPTMTADGKYLLFSSNRPGGLGESDLYWVARASVTEPWGTPINMGRPINSNLMERGSCVGPDGLTLIVGSDRPGGVGRNDLWITRRAALSDRWGRLENMGALVNSSLADKSPNLSSDGLVLVFNSDRGGGFGRNDLYMATRPSLSEPFGKAVNLGAPVNTFWNDEHPALSPDGKTLWFSSKRQGGQGDSDIWYSQRVKRTSTSANTSDNLVPLSITRAEDSPNPESPKTTSSPHGEE